MKPLRAHLRLLRLAALLTPHTERREWYAEWTAELWCVPPSRAASFCMGAFKDALWLRCHHPLPNPRLSSPWLCLGTLALLATVSLYLTSGLPVLGPPTPTANLVMIARAGHHGAQTPAIRLDQYQSWNNPRQRIFTELAYYQTTRERIPAATPAATNRTPKLLVARASENLFRLLNIPVPSARTASLILSHTAWREFFAADPHVAGRVLEIAGRPVVICGVLPDGLWSLPGRVDAWLLENSQGLSALPAGSKGFVIAQVRKSSTRYMFVSNPSGDRDYFECVPLSHFMYPPYSGFLMILAMAGILLPVTTSLSLGEYPSTSRPLRWFFLAAKLALILIIVFGATQYMAQEGRPIHIVLLGAILALRWALQDQRQRCPVCLRLLTHPVRIGHPSQTFLAWYGTEFVCTRGHGFLHVPETVPSGYNPQQWLIV